jgi:hypothetical protein
MKSIITLVPIHKPELSPIEQFTLGCSLEVLKQREIAFLGPAGLDQSFYRKHFGELPYLSADPSHFQTLHSYSNFLLTPSFYEPFLDYEFILLLQPDAIVLRDDLDLWTASPYDYIGAPWPQGWSVQVNVAPFTGPLAKQVVVYVGNGGLSLRRVRPCLGLLEKHQQLIAECQKTSTIEDVIYAVMGALSEGFVLPNQMTASLFSLELNPSHYFALNQGKLPMGGHAWWKYEPEFWRPHLPSKIPF